MKIKEMVRLMSDHGTNPRVKIVQHTLDGMSDYALLAYEGRPDGMNDEIAKLKINSFTVLGTGLIEIHAQ